VRTWTDAVARIKLMSIKAKEAACLN